MGGSGRGEGSQLCENGGCIRGLLGLSDSGLDGRDEPEFSTDVRCWQEGSQGPGREGGEKGNLGTSLMPA